MTLAKCSAKRLELDLGKQRLLHGHKFVGVPSVPERIRWRGFQTETAIVSPDTKALLTENASDDALSVFAVDSGATSVEVRNRHLVK